MVMVRRRFSLCKLVIAVALVLCILIMFDLLMSLNLDMELKAMNRGYGRGSNVPYPDHYKNKDVKDAGMHQVPMNQDLNRKKHAFKISKIKRLPRHRHLKRKRKIVKQKRGHKKLDLRGMRRRHQTKQDKKLIPEVLQGKRDKMEVYLNKTPENVQGKRELMEAHLNKTPELVQGKRDQMEAHLNKTPELVQGKRDQMEAHLNKTPELVQGKRDQMEAHLNKTPELVQGKRDQIVVDVNKKPVIIEEKGEQDLNRKSKILDGKSDQTKLNLKNKPEVLEEKKNDETAVDLNRKPKILEGKEDQMDQDLNRNINGKRDILNQKEVNKIKYENSFGKTEKPIYNQRAIPQVKDQLNDYIMAQNKQLKGNVNVNQADKVIRKDETLKDHVKLINANESREITDKRLEVKMKPSQVNVNYPGKDGAAVVIDRQHLSPEEQLAYDAGLTLHEFNQFVSDLIPVDRSLPDQRAEECKRIKYPDDLPNTSVIICFHNEAWSTLLRTVHSVINKSPPKLLKEIILVDDYSDFDYLGTPLDRYMARFGVVKIIHAKERLGLIRGRLHGVAAATGTVLTFLDSHIECLNGWLEPLLARVALSWKHVAWPNIPNIDRKTFEFKYVAEKQQKVGGFYWTMNFHWIDVPDDVRKTQQSFISPLPSPTMAGGLFSIHKKYFEYLGSYDQGMEIWGSENLELSFKIWMCGGVIESVPCSIVGHVFRKRTNLPELKSGKLQRKNSARLVEVWLDEYKEFYYEMLNFQKVDFGNVSDRQALRQQLGCHSFDWYLKNVNPTMFVPNDANIIIKGSVNSKHFENRCLGKRNNLGQFVPLSLNNCNNAGGLQMFYLTRNNELRHQFTCLDVDIDSTAIGFNNCDTRRASQRWFYLEDTSIYNKLHEKCLEASMKPAKVQLANCTGKTNQKWKWLLRGIEMQPRT